MSCGQHDPEDVVQQWRSLEVARRDLRERLVVVDQCEVELAGLDPWDQTRQVIVYDGQRDVCVQLPEACEGWRHERGERGREAPEAQPPAASRGDLAELLFGVVEAREDSGGVA